MERSRVFPKAARGRLALRDDKVALSLMREISQKRQHFLNAISSDKTQTLTDAEEICRMGFLGSALNLPQHIGSQRKLSQMIKELD